MDSFTTGDSITKSDLLKPGFSQDLVTRNFMPDPFPPGSTDPVNQQSQPLKTVIVSAMLTPFQVSIIFVLVLLVQLLITNQRAKEHANSLAKRLCQQHGLQFLDGTVAMESIGLSRTHGFVSVRRSFRFEYSINQFDRFRGTLILIGRHIETLEINPAHMESGREMTR